MVTGVPEPRRALVEPAPPASGWQQPLGSEDLLERHPRLDRALGVLAHIGRWAGRVLWAVVQAVLPS